jgi:tRNA-Thr(GGU) m(6)t(6)A37 methyltransferase TsaA
MAETIHFNPIGTLYTPFERIENMPIQPGGARGVRGKLVLRPEYARGLLDLEAFSHLYLLYHFHQVREAQMIVTPFLDSRPHGVFATRAPKRPNPIGLSVVMLVEVQDNILIVENVDILNETPILDIKPYIPAFDLQENVRTGWLSGKGGDHIDMRSDERFK